MNGAAPRQEGADIGRDDLPAYLRTPAPGLRRRSTETSAFPSFASGLEAVAANFGDQEVPEVAIDVTGPYWKPLWNVLERRECSHLFVNPHHAKLVSGRKSNPPDAEGLAGRVGDSLRRASSVRPEIIRELQGLSW